MSHKKFILVTLLGAFLIFSLLPMFNYKVDRWRVLHVDYDNSYFKVVPNITYLKPSFLLENIDKYNGLVMGSSRGNQINSMALGPNYYNMSYSFGHVSVHTHNLKLLLENGMKVNEILLAIDDFYIWKDPIDYWNDYLRRPYPVSISDTLDFYIFYLFKEPNAKDFQLFFNEVKLTPTDKINNPNIKEAVKSEENFRAGKIWRDRMGRPILLGYTEKFRTDEVLEEIKALKKICDENNIKLTMYMNPLYFNTYIAYNQTEIEIFKRGIVQISEFYDYYQLQEFNFVMERWSDPSHFLPSVGNEIINDIQSRNNIVTKDNIETHLLDVRKTHANLLKYPQDGIINFNYNFNLDYLKPLFDIRSGRYKLFGKTKYITGKEVVQMNTDSTVYGLILNETKTKSEMVVLSCDIESPVNTSFKIYYKEANGQKYNEKMTVSIPLEKGRNQFNLLIPAKYVNNQLRIHIGSRKGKYTIHKFIIYGN